MRMPRRYAKVTQKRRTGVECAARRSEGLLGLAHGLAGSRAFPQMRAIETEDKGSTRPMKTSSWGWLQTLSEIVTLEDRCVAVAFPGPARQSTGWEERQSTRVLTV